jgi:hypothetical protein
VQNSVGIFADLYGNQKPFIVGGMFAHFSLSLIRVIFPTGGGYFGSKFFSRTRCLFLWIVLSSCIPTVQQEGTVQTTGMIISIHIVGIFLGFAAGMILP